MLLRKKKNIRGQRGDTTVTVLIAAALIALAAVSSGTIIKFLRSETLFTRTTGSAIAVETYLLTALQAPETYAGVAATSLAQGQPPAALNLVMNQNGVNALVAAMGTATKLTDDGTPCALQPCALSTHIDISCANTICRAAYRIEFNAAVLKMPLPALGASAWPPKLADYSQIISPELYRRQGAKLKCSPPDLFVTGENKSTGEVTCVHSTTRKLASNEIPKGLAFSVGTGSLEFKTVALKKGVCPAKYVAQSVLPASLETTPAGTCVYRYKKQVPWMKPWPASSESVSQRFCPAHDYNANGAGSCVGRIVSQSNGTCPKTCTDAQGKSYDCSYTVPPDTSFSIQQSVSGPNVSCALVHTGTQQCGASWVGAVSWSGTCDLTVPETVSMGGG
jgi:hypothetical protein